MDVKLMPDNVVSPTSVPAPDPQQAVDEVLATADVPTVKTEVSPTPISTPQVLPVLPEPPVSPVPKSLAPVLPPAPTPVQESPPPQMNEELPLSLVTPSATSPATPIEPMPSPDEPVTVLAPLSPKPKKGGKILAFLAGFVLLVAGILGGFYYYSNQFQKIDPIIAGVLTQSYDKASCHGCLRGGKLVWRAEGCVVSGTCKPGDDNLQWLDIRDSAQCAQAGGVYCAGCKGFCNISTNRGCNDLQQAKCGEMPQYGANWVKATSGTCPGGYSKKCNCGTSDYCFSSDGYCGDEVGQASADTLAHGLCESSVDPSKQGDGVADQINSGTGTQVYFCANRFDNLAAGCQDQLVGNDFNLNCFCGTVQIDRPGQGFETKSMQCGCKDDTKIDTNRSMSCTGITRTPNTEVGVGSKVTFTCAGKLTGVPNGTLTYKFRYQVNAGNWANLTNKTTTTAELSIAACGSYKVQCQACVKVLNVTKCDPVWQGATTP